MDIINIDKLIRVLNGYCLKGNTTITLEQLIKLFEEYKDTALFGDSSFGYITEPGKQYEEEIDVVLSLESFKNDLRGYDLTEDAIDSVVNVLRDYINKLLNLEDIDGEVLLGELCNATNCKISADSFEIKLKQNADIRIRTLAKMLFN